MPYIYRVSRREPARDATVETPAAKPEPQPDEPAEPSYRDLQGQAKELGISAKQTREELETAIAEANP